MLCVCMWQIVFNLSIPRLYTLSQPQIYSCNPGTSLYCTSVLGNTQDEVEEVEAKLEASEQQPHTKWQRVLTRLCTPVFLEALILTFLAGQIPLPHHCHS